MISAYKSTPQRKAGESVTRSSLRPTLTLDTIYSPELILVPRPSSSYCNWLPLNIVAMERLSGGMLTVAGALPVLCATSVASPNNIQLLRDAGFSIPERLYRFRNTAEHQAQLADLLQSKGKIALQHVYPVSELPAENCWVDPAALSYLNNKAHLEDFVDAPQLPLRKKFSVCHLPLHVSDWRLPVVIKAVTDESTGGGFDVMICNTRADVDNASTFFSRCDHVIVEKYLAMQHNLCLNYAVNAEGLITYLGSCEQIIDCQGNYHGNWLDDEGEAPPLAIESGFQIVRKGFTHGYYGCIGIDMAILEDGRVIVYDLNFRLNGSTPALMLEDSIRKKHRRSVLCLRSFGCKDSYKKVLDTVYTAMAAGSFLPLVSCDPTAGESPKEHPSVSGILMGDTREEIAEIIKELGNSGLEVV